jgi:S1-C subfamily serine protease
MSGGALTALSRLGAACLLLTALGAADLERMQASFVFVGAGSGVVVSTDGLVLTNHHVYREMTTLAVRTITGRTIPAQVLGTDPVGDITLLRAAASDLVPAEFAASADLVAGAAVVAVGNPFGLGDLDDRPTVTFGVLGTARVARGSYPDAVVSDAAVNPGNSGGPLFLATGRLAGINGAIRARSGFRINSGIGLAISAPQLARFLPHLETARGGLVRRCALPKGLVIEDAAEGPLVRADHGALRAGDRVLAVDDRPVAGAAAAAAYARALPWAPGVMLPLRVARGALELDLELVAGRTPIPGRPMLGLAVSERGGRLEASAVTEDGPAARAGLRNGQVIVSVGQTEMRGRIDWLRAVAGLEPGDRIEVLVAEVDGEPRPVSWQLPASEP